MITDGERDSKIPASLIERPEFAAACAARDMGKVFELAIKYGLSKNAMTRMTGVKPDHIRQVISGRRRIEGLEVFERIADGLGIPGAMIGLAPRSWEPVAGQLAARAEPDDEEDALELARRVNASDVGSETVGRLESVFDELAMAYSISPPQELIGRIRTHLGYVSKLMDGRKTLDEHRRLLVVGGWLSLLAATVHIDLKQQVAAAARLQTASSLAFHAEQDEIQAWCLETKAWRAVTDGDYPRAVRLAQAAQAAAPAGSSALTQATAQEGRAWARLHQNHETYDAMRRVRALVESLPVPEQPGHHYRYDPDKFTAYSATTLAWLGDPAAEAYARELIANLQGAEGNGRWPRRIASAHLDLALTLLITDRLDEAAAAAMSAISSRHVAPSNYWRALEVVTAVEARSLPEAVDLREAFQALRSSRLTITR